MRARVALIVFVLLGCGPGSRNGQGDAGGHGDGHGNAGDACVGAQCMVVNCVAMNMSPTTFKGTVYAPNGTLPLYGINVYAPSVDPGPMATGLQCDRCTDVLPGIPVGTPQQTDEHGNFTLTNVPSGSNIEVVIASGKWRRVVKLPSVTPCSSLTLGTADTTLPKSMTDMTPNTVSVSMPKIAISTGALDALECLIRKLGISDTEINTYPGGGHVNLFSDTMSAGSGASSFANGFAGGTGSFADSQTLWGSMQTLTSYDILINSCEGAQYSTTKSQTEMNNVKAYADMGGRVFLSHWHNIWIEGAIDGSGSQAPAVWRSIATWGNSQTEFDTPPDTIDEANNPKGSAFATWMMNVGGSTLRDQIDIGTNSGKQTCNALDNTKAERWVYWTGGGGSSQVPQDFQFTTPNEAPLNQRCGKVAFSDMHVSGDSSSSPNTPYPGGCATSALTPQEKALAFMFFDIASCVPIPIQ
jgi:hypothetical protein